MTNNFFGNYEFICLYHTFNTSSHWVYVFLCTNELIFFLRLSIICFNYLCLMILNSKNDETPIWGETPGSGEV